MRRAAENGRRSRRLLLDRLRLRLRCRLRLRLALLPLGGNPSPPRLRFRLRLLALRRCRHLLCLLRLRGQHLRLRGSLVLNLWRRLCNARDGTCLRNCRL